MEILMYSTLKVCTLNVKPDFDWPLTLVIYISTRNTLSKRIIVWNISQSRLLMNVKNRSKSYQYG